MLEAAAKYSPAISRFVPAVAVLASGVALRAYVYQSSLGIPDSDEAVVGLMTRHVLHGQFTAFFWGQGYGGSQEAVLTLRNAAA